MPAFLKFSFDNTVTLDSEHASKRDLSKNWMHVTIMVVANWFIHYSVLKALE